LHRSRSGGATGYPARRLFWLRAILPFRPKPSPWPQICSAKIPKRPCRAICRTRRYAVLDQTSVTDWIRAIFHANCSTGPLMTVFTQTNAEEPDFALRAQRFLAFAERQRAT